MYCLLFIVGGLLGLALAAGQLYLASLVSWFFACLLVLTAGTTVGCSRRMIEAAVAERQRVVITRTPPTATPAPIADETPAWLMRDPANRPPPPQGSGGSPTTQRPPRARRAAAAPATPDPSVDTPPPPPPPPPPRRTRRRASDAVQPRRRRIELD